MPDRIIRESALTSESLARLPDFAERLFLRLTVVADDYGRFNANVSVVRGRCMPLIPNATEKRIETALKEIERVDSIRLYEVDGKRFGYFVNWPTHQRTRQGRPKFPAPPTCIDSPQIAATRGESPPGAALFGNGNVNVNGNENGTSKPKSKRSQKSKTRFPENFELTPELRDYAFKHKCDPDTEFERFRLHALDPDKNVSHSDWSLAYQRWILNAVGYRKERDQLRNGNGPQVLPPTMDEHLARRGRAS